MKNSLFILPALSGLLIVLSFPPLHLWPLLVPGMALYFYMAADPRRSYRAVWWGAFLPGAMLGGWVTYNGLSHMSLLSGAAGFSYLVHISPFFIAILFGNVFGAVAALYRYLLTGSPLFNGVLGASLYTLGELFQQYLWQGYYWGSFSHAFVSFAPALSVAGVGGASLVSFLIAWGACTLAQVPLRRAVLPAAAVFCACCAVLYGGSVLATPHRVPAGSLQVAVVQATNQDILFSEGSPFTAGEAYSRLAQAGRSGAQLVIYPYTPAQGALYRGAAPAAEVRNKPIVAALSELNGWASAAAAPTTTVMVWQSVYDSTEDRFYETFQFIKNGAAEAEYKKQLLYPYTDYFPAWVLGLGLADRNDALTPGPTTAYTQVGLWRVGALDCSEINQPGLARLEARGAQFLLSVGTDAMFNNEAPAQYSLASARYRAAENNIPVVRAALFGPSAIINPDGSVATRLGTGAPGILYGTVQFYLPHQTLYNRFGSAPLLLFIAAVLAAAALLRYKKL